MKDVPALDSLEMKIDLMHELNLEFKSLVKDINEATSDEDTKAAKRGDEAIMNALQTVKNDVDDVDGPSFKVGYTSDFKS